MKLDAITDNPQGLVTAIDKAIKDGVLKTWKKVLNKEKETLYSHIPEQWDEIAMPKPYIKKDMVTFQICWWENNGEPDEATKGYILGRFSEVLMVHFRQDFKQLIIS